MVVLHYAKAQPEVSHPRLGITASRKVGNAVIRQRVKRRIREIYRRWEERVELPSRDFVVHVKPAAAQAEFRALQEELLRLLRKANRIENRPS